MIRKLVVALPLVLIAILSSCKEQERKTSSEINSNSRQNSTVQYAEGFSIQSSGTYTILTVKSPWPGADKVFTYALVPREKLAVITLPNDKFDAIVATPIERLIVTSTTHIPALENLDGLEKLIGFPDTQYISSKKARNLIKQGQIEDLGSNETLNTEMVLNLNPDVVVGFGIDNQNAVYETISKAGIPVLYNGDWTEESPLGKAEWLKFFGALLQKESEADSIFKNIAESYKKMKSIASKAKTRPTVLSGALYKDVWYLPAGESWASQFLTDANADYLWADTSGNGSLSLGLEAVLAKAQSAVYWVSPSQFTSYDEMEAASNHYNEFEAFKEKKVYTFASTKGESGGLLYYELAPHRPDLVLKDLVSIFHPELLPGHQPYFFKPLKE